jgi:hypothetical protein
MVYQLNIAADGAFALIPGDLRYFHDHFIGLPMSAHWEGAPPFTVATGRAKINDFVAWFMSAPIISKRAKTVIEEIDRENTEILPFGILKGNEYFALNVLGEMDFIDLQKSDIFFSHEGAQGLPKSIILKDGVGAIPSFFRLKYIRDFIWVSDDCANLLIASNLTGFGLTLPSTNVMARVIHGQPMNDHPQLR